MASRLIAGRLVIARDLLRVASCAADVLPAAAAMIELASDLGDADEAGVTRARGALDDSVRYLRAAMAELPADGHDYPGALYLLAEAALLRDRDDGLIPDIEDAVACLRRLRALLGVGTPDRAEVDRKLGSALFTLGCRPRGRLADLDEGGALLESARDSLAPDDQDRRQIGAALAIQRAARYGLHGGTEADRDAALTFARACLTAPDSGGADRVAIMGHAVVAWMMLTRQLTADQRVIMGMNEEVAAARAGGQATAALLERLGNYQISPEDAEAAIAHLRQVPDVRDDATLRGFVPLLWVMALFATVQARGSFSADLVADVLRVADDLGQAASDAKPDAESDDLMPGELLAMRAALLTVQAKESGAETAASDETAAAAAIALSEAAAGLPAGHLFRPSVLGELGAAFGRRVSEAQTSDDLWPRLARILDEMDRMPSDDPAFARRMLAVGVQMLSVGSTDRSMLQQDWLVSRLERLTSNVEPADSMYHLAQYMQWSVRLAHAFVQHRTEAVDGIIDELARLLDSVPAGDALRPFMLVGLASAYMDRHTMGGELRYMHRANDAVDKAIEEAGSAGPFGEGGQYHGALLYFRGHLRAVWCYYDPDLERVTGAIDDLELAAAQFGPGDALSPGIVSALEIARLMRDGMRADAVHPMYLGTQVRQASDELLKTVESVGRHNPQYPTLVSQAANGLMLRGLADHDITLIDQAIRMLAEASSLEDLAVRERPRFLEGHGQALLTRYWLTRVPRDLSNAIDRLEEARRAVEQETGSPHAASVLQALAGAYRTRANAARGDVDRAVTLGLTGLREHAGDVFLQDNEENALLMARRGTSDATEMARWFLGNGREEAAVSALELGRGMVLHAATAGAGVEQVLREAGHADLADKWARQPQVPGNADTDAAGDLRYRVMLAIEQSPAEARLLSAPAVADIAAALTATGNDALAYLLPRDEDGPGLAVVVSSDGAIRRLPLPGLYTGGGSPVGAFLRTRRAVETAEVIQAAEHGNAEYAARTAAARKAWLEVLDPLCGWAWRTAIRPLFDAIGAPRGGAERRIVLVPAGELGLVPWHAAREPRSGRYACQDAAFSYASSARQFVETAGRRPRPWAQAPVLISDASESLYLTASGIAYLHAAHYPTGAVFGYAHDRLDSAVPGGSDASRGAVLDALPRAGLPGASLLHFGCHGRVQIPILGSSLRLGTDDTGAEAEVKVQDILSRARSGRGGGLAGEDAGGLVVLAACLTDVTESDFDEALTLATAFLAAGAVGVVAARWSVADRTTALFMNVFHQFLNGPHTRPARALRAAQLWMLNPDRAVPAGWPRVLREEAAMAGSHGGPDLAGPEAWAGFTYQGW